MTRAAEMDLRESEQTVAQLKAQAENVLAEYRAALDALNTRWMQTINDVVELKISPRKSDIFADLIVIAWA